MATLGKYSFNRKITIAAFGLLLLHSFTLFLLGENAYFLIHDNIDSDFAYLHILSATHSVFNTPPGHLINNMMHGIPRNAFRPGLDITAVLFYLFPSYLAYILNYFLVHLVGFWGMFLLLKKHFIHLEKDHWIVALCSLIFSFAGYYTIYGCTIAGLPFLLLAFLNIRKSGHGRWVNYLIIALYVVWSLSYLIAPFIVFGISILLVCDVIKFRKINFALLWSIVSYGVLVALVNYQLIYTTLFNLGFISHRTEWGSTSGILSGFDFAKSFIKTIGKTPYHTGEFYTLLIFVAALMALYFHYRQNKSWHPQLSVLLTSVLCISIIVPLSYLMVERFSSAFPFIKTFQFSRFNFFLSFLWIIIFAIAIREVSVVKSVRLISIALIALQLVLVMLSNPETVYNTQRLFGSKTKEPTYAQYIAKDLFATIEKYINKPKEQYRVVSIGIHPSVAQINGFYTLDSYQNNYPLSYKYEFRKVIAPELDKSTELKNYFDSWGSRCYIFANELGQNYLYGKDNNTAISNLNINSQQLKLMGCEYIFSSVKIQRPSTCQLLFKKQFTDPNAFMDIYLYQVL